MVIVRPRRFHLVAFDAPLPIRVTCKGLGLPWPSEVKEPITLPAPSAVSSASCTVCRIGNIYGPPRCFAENCPRRIPR